MVCNLILGFFDGVHIGHRAVIQAADSNGKNILLTLKDSPAIYFGKDKEYIFSRKKSYNILKSIGVDEIVELDFPKIVTMPADNYLEYLVEKFSPSFIITGFNHTFGFEKGGNSEFLRVNAKKFGYKYICVPPKTYDDKIVSSTLIKSYLKDGYIEIANRLLNNKFSIDGEVIHGAKLGRTIGFPTANIKYPEGIVQIPFGVYACSLEIEKNSKKAIMNWGMKPTVNNTKEPVAEIHILDFEGDLYGQNIEVQILNRIRGEIKFSDLDELKSQINKDIKECLKL